MISPDDMLRELLQTFRAEAAEHLQTLNMTLLALEVRPEEPRRQELVQEAFRAAHSLKGAARAVSLDAIERLANAMEDVLEQARAAQIYLAPSSFDVLYDVLDSIGQLLEGQTVEVEPLISRLTSNTQSAPRKKDAESPVFILTAPGLSDNNSSNTPSSDPSSTPSSDIGNNNNHQSNEDALSAPEKSEPAPPVPASRSGTSRTVEARAVETRAVENAPSEEAAPVPLSVGTEETIRVAISKLDNLMAQVGELVVSRMNSEQRAVEMRGVRLQLANWAKIWRELKMALPELNDDRSLRIAEIVAECDEQIDNVAEEIGHFDQRLRQDTLRLGVISAQLQDSVRHVRMVPFETLVPGMQRAARDAARLEDKQVAFSVTGGEVELDKKVLESLKDPFLHLVRNAISHGIEKPDVRKKAGKPAEGQVTLSVQQRGSEVRITIQDDGAGFDLDGLRQAGKKRNGTDPQYSSGPDSAIELAFMPGVTTAREVTSLSGRGIGLDVVRQRLEDLQGHIQVDSIRGEGSSIHLLVPSSLTISRGLLVRVGDERYVLPLLSVVKIIEPRETFTVGEQTMIAVEGATLPLVELATLLERSVTTQSRSASLAVIMAVAEQRVALLVDDVLTEQELAVKPLAKPLRYVHNVAGAALMGDGTPIVVLNAADLVRAAKGRPRLTRIEDQNETREDTVSHVLVVDDSITTRTLEKHILETAGYDVTTATDGREALLRLKESHIDLVVSDVQMPNMDGIALTRHLRESSDYKDLPLILVTSLESSEDRERGMVAGANAYIVKRGFDQAELLKTVQQLVYAGGD